MKNAMAMSKQKIMAAWTKAKREEAWNLKFQVLEGAIPFAATKRVCMQKKRQEGRSSLVSCAVRYPLIRHYFSGSVTY